jgi:alkylation response protein AidB-like acyl-CoA dehydrogenase
MRIGYTPEQEALEAELRGYFTELMTPALVEELTSGGEGGGPQFRAALRKLGRDGWLGIGWPKEFGGQGRTPMEQYIFASEVQRVGFPLPMLTLETVGPTIMRYGSERQKADLLPKILAGDMLIAIGYSEPNAGTDLAALVTRAERDGDDWVINGQKTWTSLADHSDYIWLAARTDPQSKRHRGISMFLVPTNAPGFSLQPIWTLGGVRTNATFFENVRLPASAMVGPENGGWGLITNQLNRERVSLLVAAPLEALYDEVVRHARDTKRADGTRVIDVKWVQHHLARVRAGIGAMKLLCWKNAWSIANDTLHPADASATKVFGSEFRVEAYRLLLEVIGQRGLLRKGSPEAVLAGRVERAYRSATILTFGGGTNEIQRDIISAAGLGMPREAR